MTPGARVAAAIEILDRVLAGEAAEPAIARWSRASRFAGSKDRAAVRDHVFDALRAKRSLAAQGGAATGRAITLALAAREGAVDQLFTGEGHAPAPPTPAEAAALAATPEMTEAEAADLPDWLWPLWQRALGEDAPQVAALMRERAGVFLRVNLRRTSREEAQVLLGEDRITAAPVSEVPTALQVTEGARRVKSARAYLDGLVELQDTASQIAVACLPLTDGMRVLDYCAGGGGKALAMADRARIAVSAHDAAPARMVDIPARAARAGVAITVAPPGDLKGAFDLVLVDAPCSGSGTWRRTPDAKWRLTPEALAELTALQRDILTEASRSVGDAGELAYATCSVLDAENEAVVRDFLAANPGWTSQNELRLRPTPLQDGFYLNVLRNS